MVNDQLAQLYVDLELEGFSAKITLTDSDDDDDTENNDSDHLGGKDVKQQMSTLAMIFEENAIIPAPH